jgi:hypothetical protein
MCISTVVKQGEDINTVEVRSIRNTQFSCATLKRKRTDLLPQATGLYNGPIKYLINNCFIQSILPCIVTAMTI